MVPYNAIWCTMMHLMHLDAHWCTRYNSDALWCPLMHSDADDCCQVLHCVHLCILLNIRIEYEALMIYQFNLGPAGTLLCTTIHTLVHSGALRFSIVPSGASSCLTVHSGASWCTLKHFIAQCSPLMHSIVFWCTLVPLDVLRFTWVHSNALCWKVVYCFVLHCTLNYCCENVYIYIYIYIYICICTFVCVHTYVVYSKTSLSRRDLKWSI